MKLETDRLILREYTMDDFDSLYQIMSDAETMQHYPVSFDEERTRAWIEWNLENYKKYWRRGFAKAASRAVRDWVFENTEYDAIYSYMK